MLAISVSFAVTCSVSKANEVIDENVNLMHRKAFGLSPWIGPMVTACLQIVAGSSRHGFGQSGFAAVGIELISLQTIIPGS